MGSIVKVTLANPQFVSNAAREQRCNICEGLRRASSRYCDRCATILRRVDTRRDPLTGKKYTKHDRDARERALKSAWDRDSKIFRCQYTNLPLKETWNKTGGNPFYLSFDHRTPGDETDLVVIAYCINCMKGKQTEAEFRRLVLQVIEPLRIWASKLGAA